jgi:hypothetical protein
VEINNIINDNDILYLHKNYIIRLYNNIINTITNKKQKKLYYPYDLMYIIDLNGVDPYEYVGVGELNNKGIYTIFYDKQIKLLHDDSKDKSFKEICDGVFDCVNQNTDYYNLIKYMENIQNNFDWIPIRYVTVAYIKCINNYVINIKEQKIKNNVNVNVLIFKLSEKVYNFYNKKTDVRNCFDEIKDAINGYEKYMIFSKTQDYIYYDKTKMDFIENF